MIRWPYDCGHRQAKDDRSKQAHRPVQSEAAQSAHPPLSQTVWQPRIGSSKQLYITMYINTQSSDRGQTKCISLQRLYSILTLHGPLLKLATLLLILYLHSLPHILTATAVSLQTAGPSETRLILVSRSGAAEVRFCFGYLLFCLINSSAKDKKTCDTARSTGPPYKIYTHTCFELAPSRRHERLGQKNKGAHDVLSCQ